MTISHLPQHTFKIITLFIAFTISVSSCKKKNDPNDIGESADYKVQNDVRDSAYLKTKDIYLWPEKLPSISEFKPRSLKTIFDVMDKVKTYQSLDKWSFAETKAETEESQSGASTDFGFLIKFLPGSNTEIRITYVYANSTAGQAGIKRSWRLNKINGRIINRSVPTDVDFINDVFFGAPQSATFEFIKPDGTTLTTDLQKTSYVLNTVLYRNVYIKGSQGSQKIGYLVFNQFAAATSITELESAMSYFQTQGVNEMIVDLRYNRGGYVSTQDFLANSLAPQSVGKNQTVMYTYKFNDKYKEWDESYKFNKRGTLNLSRVVFIVSPSSASASELLINNLKPVMTVKLIGDTRTYGKPVGFFPIPVFQYNIFPVSFKTINSAGSADYFSGFPVDKNVPDDLMHDFGDESEANLSEALKYFTNGGTFASAPAQISSVESQKVKQLNAEFSDHLPSVTIEDRPSRMPLPIRNLQR
ncbi:MAG TPA: S41 family peptidase [Pedobacter sp.]|jgi:C-terminal processing protease CtpA/Prc